MALAAKAPEALRYPGLVPHERYVGRYVAVAEVADYGMIGVRCGNFRGSVIRS